MMVWEVARHEKRMSDAPACSSCVPASTAPHLAGDDRLRGRRRGRPRKLSSIGDADAQESEQGILAVECCHDSRCKNSVLEFE